MLDVRSDLKFGLGKEDYVLQRIKNVFQNDNIRNTKEMYGDYCIFDFESTDGTSWEVKSRRNTKSQYPTTILPVHKARTVETKQYYVFHFLDATSYIEYDKELFDTFKISYIYDGRPNGSHKSVPHFEIPVGLLTDFPIDTV
jgi:hypothetical protein